MIVFQINKCICVTNRFRLLKCLNFWNTFWKLLLFFFCLKIDMVILFHFFGCFFGWKSLQIEMRAAWYGKPSIIQNICILQNLSKSIFYIQNFGGCTADESIIRNWNLYDTVFPPKKNVQVFNIKGWNSQKRIWAFAFTPIYKS